MEKRTKNMTENPGIKLGSTTTRIVLAIIVLILPINILTIILSGMATRSSRDLQVSETQNLMQVSRRIIDLSLRQSTRQLLFRGFDNEDYITLARRGAVLSNSEKATLLPDIKKDLQRLHYDHHLIDLMYVDFPESDLTLMDGYPGVNTQVIRQLIHEKRGETITGGIHWQVLEIAGKAMLFSYTTWNKMSTGVLVNLERLAEKLGLRNMAAGRTLFFTNAENTIFSLDGEVQAEDLEVKASWFGNEVQKEDFPGYDLQLVAVTDWSRRVDAVSLSLLVALIVSAVLTITVIPFLLWYTARWIYRPLKRLTSAIDHIEQGDMQYRIEDSLQGKEFDQINSSFNQMMDQVAALKIDVYERELERNQIKMRYLSQQIQPHFILNAMNVLYSYEPEDYQLSRKMILCIAKYFRYVVNANSDFVLLQDEMDHIKNYFEIQKARFPGNFFSLVHCHNELTHALIPPLLVQNFAENTIKHSLKSGEKIVIAVTADYVEPQESHRKIRIVIEDDGAGISDEILQKIRTFQETGKMQTGLGIGITNTIERMKHLYADQATIVIGRNPKGIGTRVEIVLPLFIRGEEAESDALIID